MATNVLGCHEKPPFMHYLDQADTNARGEGDHKGREESQVLERRGGVRTQLRCGEQHGEQDIAGDERARCGPTRMVHVGERGEDNLALLLK